MLPESISKRIKNKICGDQRPCVWPEKDVPAIVFLTGCTGKGTLSIRADCKEMRERKLLICL